MQVSFLRLWENMQDDPGPLDDSGLESKSMSVIRTGDQLRGKKECGNFWDDFIQLCNDAVGLADLLGARPHEVQLWAAKVREAQEKVKRADSQQDSKNTMLPTGGGGDALAQGPSNDNPPSA